MHIYGSPGRRSYVRIYREEVTCTHISDIHTHVQENMRYMYIPVARAGGHVHGDPGRREALEGLHPRVHTCKSHLFTHVRFIHTHI